MYVFLKKKKKCLSGHPFYVSKNVELPNFLIQSNNLFVYFLQGAVSVINSKLSLLEPSNLEHVEVRLHSVIQKLDKIAEKKSTQEDGEKQNKVRNINPCHAE